MRGNRIRVLLIPFLGLCFACIHPSLGCRADLASEIMGLSVDAIYARGSSAYNAIKGTLLSCIGESITGGTCEKWIIDKVREAYGYLAAYVALSPDEMLDPVWAQKITTALGHCETFLSQERLALSVTFGTVTGFYSDVPDLPTESAEGEAAWESFMAYRTDFAQWAPHDSNWGEAGYQDGEYVYDAWTTTAIAPIEPIPLGLGNRDFTLDLEFEVLQGLPNAIGVCLMGPENLRAVGFQVSSGADGAAGFSLGRQWASTSGTPQIEYLVDEVLASDLGVFEMLNGGAPARLRVERTGGSFTVRVGHVLLFDRRVGHMDVQEISVLVSGPALVALQSLVVISE